MTNREVTTLEDMLCFNIYAALYLVYLILSLTITNSALFYRKVLFNLKKHDQKSHLNFVYHLF